MIRLASAALAICAALIGAAQPARAAEVTLGIQPNLVNWQHDEAAFSSNSGLFGVIGELKVRQSRFELYAEGIPGVSGSGPSDPPNAIGTPSIAALHFDARYYVLRGAFLGIGEAVYNQTTPTYFRCCVAHASSRVAGGRYSAGARFPVHGRLFAEAMLAFMPGMQGLVTYTPTPYAARSGLGEHASNVETVFAFGTRAGRAEYLIGLRNVNYTANFNSGDAADRNVVTGGFVEFRYTFGH
jgi:hypothetical protein